MLDLKWLKMLVQVCPVCVYIDNICIHLVHRTTNSPYGHQLAILIEIKFITSVVLARAIILKKTEFRHGS